MYVAQKLLPMPKNNIMTSMRLGGLNFRIFCHVNFLCEISIDLRGLMALNWHSGAPDCTLITSKSQMDPTNVIFRSENLYDINLGVMGYVRGLEVAPHGQEQHHDLHEVEWPQISIIWPCEHFL